MLSSVRDCCYRGRTESFVTWCHHNHLKLSISKPNELVVDYQRNRRPPVPDSHPGWTHTSAFEPFESIKKKTVVISAWILELWPGTCFVRSQWPWPLTAKFSSVVWARCNEIFFQAFLRYHVDENGTDVRSQWPWPLTFEHQHLKSVQVDVCAKFVKIPSERSWDIARQET